MIQNGIDLIEDPIYQNPYYFCLRLLNLKNNKRKTKKARTNSHFKLLIEQDNQIIDQTPNIENVFWIMRTSSMSLNQEQLKFILPDINQSNTQFELKMYLCSHDNIEQLAVFQINTLTYVEVLLQDGKSIFRQTIALCLQYTLQYEIYIGKSQIQLENLLKSNQQNNFNLNNPFKKKVCEIIEIQNEKVEIKNKFNQGEKSIILRKSLRFNKNKLMEEKKRKQQLQQKQRSLREKGSLFSKIGTMFMPNFYENKESQNLQQKQKYHEQNEENLQESVALSPALIGPHKYNRPQNKFYYNRVNIQRLKQRQRIKKQQITSEQQYYLKQTNSYSLLRGFKIVVFLLIFAYAIYWLSSSGKRGKAKWLKNVDLLKF